MSHHRTAATSDMPVVTTSRERCTTHAIFLRPDGSCSRCDEEEGRASSARLVRWFGVAIAAIIALAVTVRGVTAFQDLRAAHVEATHAKVAAVAQAGGARVVMYTMSGCGACKSEKAWMAAHNVAYVERNIDDDPAARAELHTLAGRGVLPTTVVDGEVLVGFSAPRLEGALKAHSAL